MNITVKDGEKFSGLFFGAVVEGHDLTLALKMVQRILSNEVNGAQESQSQYIGAGDDHSLSFSMKDTLLLTVGGVSFPTQDKRTNGDSELRFLYEAMTKLDTGMSAGFRTDTDISGNVARGGRDLQRWTSSAEPNVALSLEDSGSRGDWDQFQANEKLFGLKSDYDENLYTTRIDKSNPQYRQREAEAQRIAREIEGTSTNNPHLREERGHIGDDGDLDEEERSNFPHESHSQLTDIVRRYSGVRRQRIDYPPLQSSNPNRYIPPAHRPPSGNVTVPGAPVDPAIISSQMARPEASSPRLKTSTSTDTRGAIDAVASEIITSPDNAKAITPDVSQSRTDELTTSRPTETSKQTTTNATANVEAEVLDSFKQFAEKQKMQVADHKRQRVSHDKAIKLNDLKGFSKNFKLHTPVPKDLVPILAKDKKKQCEIIEKAQRNATLQVVSPTKNPSKPGDQAQPKPPADIKRDPPRAPLNTSDRQDDTRQPQPPRGPQAGVTTRDRQNQHPLAYPAPPQLQQGLMNHRLANNQRERQAGRSVGVPSPIPVHNIQKVAGKPSVNGPQVSSSQASSTVRTPTSTTSAKFNVKAHEFRPNPAASTFKPTAPSAASSPRSNANARPASREATPSDFFGNKKIPPMAERPSILEDFNPLKRLKERAAREGKAKDLIANGGMPYAHATPVRWSDVKDGEEKSYKDMFEDMPAVTSGVSPHPSATSPVNPNLAHLHQLPPHLQQGPHGMAPLQIPQPPPPFQGPHQQQHLYPGMPHQFDEHRMHASPSAASNFSTPRMQNNFATHAPSAPPMAPYHYGQPAAYVMAPGGPQPPNFRQFPNGPQFMPSPGPAMSAPMMVHQNSQGGYSGPQGMPMPQIPMYATGPGPYNAPSQPPSGYPSPSRGASMMMHSGSYQGQTPQMHQQQYGQPFYAQQPPPHSKFAYYLNCSNCPQLIDA